MKLPEAYRALAKAARKAGWQISFTGGGHVCWRSPEGVAVFAPATPGDRRSLRNVESKLRHAGLKREGG